MKLSLQELKNRIPVPLISYNPYSTINMKSESNSCSLKVDNKTHTG